MTKLRAPLSFSQAITLIAGTIGWKQAARITRRSVRTVRHWSESDRRGSPTLDQAITLDRAHLAAGGDYPPILESYARQLDVHLLATMACRAVLADDIATAARETADAIACSIQVTQPGTAPAVIHRAIVEAEESSGAVLRLLARLKSFLPGNSATAFQPGGEK